MTKLGGWVKAAGVVIVMAVSAIMARAYDLIKDDSNIYVVAWDPGAIPMKVKLPMSPALSDDTSQSGSVVAAMQAWNSRMGTVQFQWTELGGGEPDFEDDGNEISMASTIYGEAFDANVLAVTLSYRSGNSRVEADVIFNSAYTWQSYRGALRPGTEEDIRRVAIHELGHVLGLDHPDQATPPQFVAAIMNSTASNTDSLQNDDIAGAQSLYGAPGFVPGNNDFTNAYTINMGVSNFGQANGTNVAATAESGEPALDADDPGRRTVWWKVTPAASGSYQIDTSGSNFDTLLGVYTGSGVNALTQVALNDDVTSGVVRTSSVVFNAAAGVTQYIAIDGWGGYVGMIRLTVRFTPAAPAIAQVLSSGYPMIGQPLWVQATATGAPEISYQWQRLAAGAAPNDWQPLSDGPVYSGVLTGRLTVSNVTYAMNGDYVRCIASNSAGTVNSPTYYFSVPAIAPTIQQHPQSQAVMVGQSFRFSVVASGDPAPTYQWFHDSLSNPISLAIHPSYTVHNVQYNDAGLYFVRVTNPGGSEFSTSARLTVNGPPAFPVNPADQEVVEGTSVTFEPTVTGFPSPTLRWQKDGVDLPGATGRSLVILQAQLADGGVYQLIATNQFGTASSRAIGLGVLATRPVVTLQAPLRQVVAPGSDLNLAITAEGEGELTYQWFHRGRAIAGATQPTFIQTGITRDDAGWYCVDVTDTRGTRRSAAMFVLVAPARTQLRSWGADLGGQISAAPAVDDAVAAAGIYGYSLVLRADGTLQDWGTAKSAWNARPAETVNVVAIAVGPDYALALSSDGQVAVWGHPASRVLNIPPGLSSVVAIAAGINRAAAIKSDGSVVRWGIEEAYPTPYVNPPTNLRNVVGIALGNGHTLALLADGTMAAWGANDAGQSIVPSDLGTVSMVSAGLRCSVALKSDGSVVAWGANNLGQTTVPAGLADVVDIDAHYEDVIALRRDGTVVRWGQQFEPDPYSVIVPMPVDLTDGWTVSAGGSLWSILRDASHDQEPEITIQPVNQRIGERGKVTFEVEASGAGPLLYQWRKAGVAVEGATSSVLTLREVTFAQAGSYDVLVRNHIGAVTSTTVSLAVDPVPIVTNQSSSRQVLGVGESLTLNVSATGTGTLSYRWTHNGRSIPDETGSSFTRDNLTVRDSGYYLVHITDDFGTKISAPMFVMVSPAATQILVWGGGDFGKQANVPVGLNDAVAVSASESYTLALRRDGTVVYWGFPSSLSASVPSGLADVVAVAAGSQYALALKSNGSVVGWGAVPSSFAALIPALTDVVAIAAGEQFALALRSNGTVVGASFIPVGLDGVSTISAGLAAALVAKNDGTVVGMGSESNGQSMTVGLSDIIAVSISAGQGLALRSNGEVWINTSLGQVYRKLVLPEVTSPVVAIEAGRGYSWLVQADGKLVLSDPAALIGSRPFLLLARDVLAISTPRPTWSSSAIIALRDASRDVLPSITRQPESRQGVELLSVQFSVEAEHATHYQWQGRRPGSVEWENLREYYGHLGTETDRLSVLWITHYQQFDAYRCVITSGVGSVISNAATLTLPSAIGGLHSAGGLSSGRYLKADGTLWTFGSNGFGELGDGTTSARPTPARVATGITSTAMGFDHGLYVDSEGRLFGSGYNFFGALGTGDTNQRATPVQIATDVSLASGGYRHTLFRKRDGTLWGMGWNPNGQLGDNSIVNRFSAQKIADNIGSFAAGFRHSMFVKFDGTVWVTGDNTNGVFGDGATSGTLMPRQIATDTAVVASFFHTLFIRRDGTVWSTGRNDRGQVGDGTTTVRREAIQITDRAIAVAVGQFHSLVLKEDGTLWAAGANDRGQLGDGTKVDRAQLVQVATNVATISAGVYQSCFVKTDGTLWAMGGNESGQLGDGTTTDRALPVMVASGAQGLPSTAAFLFTTNSAAADKIVLRWNWPVGATHFELWRNITNDVTTATRVARLADNYYEDLTASSGVVYYYWLKAFSPAGTLGENSPATARQGAAATPPVITSQPQNQTAMLGSNFTFTVTATGATSYQWRLNGEPLGGATAASYSAAAAPGLAGNYTVVVTNAGGSVTSGSATLIVSKLAQTITFVAPADRAYSATPFALSATASSGLPVGFTLVSGPATLAGDQLMVTGVGPVTVRAAQTGSESYEAAQEVDRSFVVTHASATITLGNLAATYDGSAKSASAATAPAGLNVTFTYDGSTTAPTNAGSYAIVAMIDEPNYTGSASDTLVIAKAAQTITFAAPANQAFSLTPITLNATATSGLPVNFSVVSGPATISDNTLMLAGSGTITVLATQAGDANREAAPFVERIFTVSGNYDSWRLAHFTAEELLNSAISGANADPDGDGLANLLEYALGFEPKSVTTTGLPEVNTTASEWTYTYTRPSERPDLVYAVESSTDLTTWTTTNVTHELVSTDAATGVQTWRAGVPLSFAATAFFRLKVSIP